MPRLVTIISILISIILLSLIGIFYAGETMDTLNTYIEQATYQSTSQNKEELEETAKKMSDFFQSRHDFLSFYVKHNDIEEISSAIVNLYGYAKLSSFDSAQLCLAQIKLLIERIYSKELPNLENLF